MKRSARAALAGVVATLLAIPGVPWLLGVRKVPANAEPLPVEDAFPYDSWDRLLKTYVGEDGRVDYESLAASREPLRRFVATLGEVGPTTRPDLFPTEAHAFAWHINAYNAATLLGIVESWPNAGVHDIHGPLNPKDGFGFFWGLRFRLDGDWTNTYDLENAVMRTRYDARLHAAINCASASCPRLRPEAYRPEALEAQLESAVRELVRADVHVAYDEAERVVALSPIFDWFAADFVAHAEALGAQASVLGWIEHYSDGPRKRLAGRARAESWSVRWAVYDWSLNGG